MNQESQADDIRPWKDVQASPAVTARSPRRLAKMVVEPNRPKWTSQAVPHGV